MTAASSAANALTAIVPERDDSNFWTCCTFLSSLFSENGDAALKAAEIAEVRRGSAFVEPSDVLDEMSDDVSAVLNRVVAGARAGEPAREVEGRKAGYGNHLVAAPGEGS